MKIEDDITALLRSRCTLLWVVTREEQRAERGIIEAAARAKYKTRLWDCATGLTDSDGEVLDEAARDPRAMLGKISESSDRCVFVMRDLHKWLDPMVLRALRSAARSLQGSPRDSCRTIVVLTPSADVPPELAGHAVVLDYPLPDRREISEILDDVLGALEEEQAKAACSNGQREAAIDAAVGLTAEEAANCYARSLVTSKTIDPAVVSQEKKRVIAREKVLTWHDPDPRGLDAIGGLDLLKEWLTKRRAGFSQAAREYGLPAPKGVMLAGVPGCGKSLTAKAVAAAWQVPLLQLDMGALKSKFVGESEGNLRKALAVAEAVSPCILWLDEIEKALAGSTGPQGDGGVSADALGAVLSWMQERKGSVFVVATANDVTGLPPELLRKGRFDDLFFVDLPTYTERAAILSGSIRKHGRDPEQLGDLGELVASTEGWTGAEISELVPDALFSSFADGARELTIADLTEAAVKVVPLSKSSADKIEALRKWAKGRARPASRPEGADTSRGSGRALDI